MRFNNDWRRLNDGSRRSFADKKGKHPDNQVNDSSSDLQELESHTCIVLRLGGTVSGSLLGDLVIRNGFGFCKHL